jgi:acyl-CoA thioesterase FadM
VRIAARTIRLGNKSMEMEYLMENVQTEKVMAESSAVLVAYDYSAQATIPIPEGWRRKIIEFEQLETV